jgi:uncharacterized membrane protein YccF (DUF307 family)
MIDFVLEVVFEAILQAIAWLLAQVVRGIVAIVGIVSRSGASAWRAMRSWVGPT